jgi:hypothetical protein
MNLLLRRVCLPPQQYGGRTEDENSTGKESSAVEAAKKTVEAQPS